MKKILVLISILLGVIIPIAALALTIDIVTPNAALAPYPGPYATAEVTLLDSTHAQIVVDTKLGYWLGGEGSFAFNPIGNVTTVASGVTLASDPYGSGNVSDFGPFGVTVKMFDGWSAAASTMTIDIIRTGGTWADVNNVLAFNGAGYRVAAHIFVGTTPGVGVALETGYAGEGTGTTLVPEPGTMLLLGLGLLGLGITSRKRS